MVVFGQNWFYSGKLVVFGQNGCIRAKNWLLFGLKLSKLVIFGQISCIRAKRLHSGKMVLFGLKLLYLGKLVVFG